MPNSNQQFMMGNEAIARGALEAGLNFASGYPGTPSSEILQTLAQASGDNDIYVEWSINEKVAAEAAAAAAFSGLKSMVTMKNAGLSVALDFLPHLSLTGLGDAGGAMVLAVCDDPDAHSSGDETDSRQLARFFYAPLLEPSSVAEAKEMTGFAFELSGEFDCFVMLRSYTRLSHSTSLAEVGTRPQSRVKAASDSSRAVSPYLAKPKHQAVIEKLEKIRARFETSKYNYYTGPDEPELIIACSGSGLPCSEEALETMGLAGRVGIMRIGTVWPFPQKWAAEQMKRCDRILVAEEVDPVLEVLLKETLVDQAVSGKTILGKASGHVPVHGEITTDRVIAALSDIFGIKYASRPESYQKELDEAVNELLISRGLTWCPGCPHRAGFWIMERSINSDGRQAYVTGDIGCYTLDVFPEGKMRMNLLHAMGSGAGLAGGFGQLGRFGYTQPVIAVCGDSTFFHASVPALISAVHNGSNMIQVILDNSATAMTGFQSHPGVDYNAVGREAQKVDVEALCRSLGCSVTVCDPFDVKESIRTVRALLKEDGVRVLIFRRKCELVRMKAEKTTPYEMTVDLEKCKGVECAICSSEFRCPALVLDGEGGKTRIIPELCCGCGVCVEICPFKAIERKGGNS